MEHPGPGGTGEAAFRKQASSLGPSGSPWPLPQHRGHGTALLACLPSSRIPFIGSLDNPLSCLCWSAWTWATVCPLPSGASLCAYNFLLGAEYPGSSFLQVRGCPRAPVPRGPWPSLEPAFPIASWKTPATPAPPASPPCPRPCSVPPAIPPLHHDHSDGHVLHTCCSLIHPFNANSGAPTTCPVLY